MFTKGSFFPPLLSDLLSFSCCWETMKGSWGCRTWKWRKGQCRHGKEIKLVSWVVAAFTNDQRFEWVSVYTENLTYANSYECRHAHMHKRGASLTFSSSRMRFSVSSLISFWACCSSLWCFSPRDCSWELTLPWSAVIRRDSSSIWVCWSANSCDVFFELAWRPTCNSVTLQGHKQTKPARSKPSGPEFNNKTQKPASKQGN